MTTIRLSAETLHELRMRKSQFDDKSYDQTIRHLLGARHDEQHTNP